MITITNLWAMLSFHWGELPRGDLSEAIGLDVTTPAELLARLLARGVESLLRRGLAVEYIPQLEEGSRIRGALALETTIARALPPRGRVAFRVDELSPDVPANRAIKATLRRLLASSGGELKAKVASSLRTHLYAFAGVADVPARPDLAAKTRCPRSHPHYAVVLDVCDFVLRHLLPEPGDNQQRLRDFTRDEVAMRRIFEGFVRNFARFHLIPRGAVFPRQRVEWAAAGASEATRRLPRMRTDIDFDRPRGDRLIVECKYVREPVRWTEDGFRLRSDHLYQLFAYLQNARLAATRERPVRGLLLYASTGGELDLEVELGGIPVRVLALDLAAAWLTVEASLLGALVGSALARGSELNA